MSDEYERMMQWAAGPGVSAAPSQVSTVSALRGWEMNQPGLVSGAGGLPSGLGDYGVSAITPTGGPSQRGFFDSYQTGPNGEQLKEQGYGMPALGVATGAFNAWLGMKQYGLAKKQLAEGKQQFNLNYDAQRTTTNAQLEGRQRSMIAGNGGIAGSNYQSVGDYMDKYGVRARG